MPDDLIPEGQRLLRYRGAWQRRRVDQPFFENHEPLIMPRSHVDARMASHIIADQMRRRYNAQPRLLQHQWKKDGGADGLNYPLQVQSNTVSFPLISTSVPQLVLPRNSRRFSLIVANPTNINGAVLDLYYCFGNPGVQINNGQFGINLLPSDTHHYVSSVIPIDDVYAWAGQGHEPVPPPIATQAFITLFEGVLAPESNAK